MNSLRYLWLLIVTALGAFAQGNLGGLTGVVSDTSSAVVPEVKITLTSEQTNVSHSVVADSSGAYSVRGLQPGTYRLEAEKTGFRKYVQENVSILTATVTTLDIQLSVGAVSDSITVTTAGVTLQTTSPEVSTVLERRAILDLPIQVGGSGATTAASGRRQPENFIFLTPGVSGIPWSKNINGSPDFSQEVLYDGISAQLAVTPGFLAQTSPPYEAVEEFKVQNSLFPAEYGRGFGVINFTLRSGSNQVHGGLFEFFPTTNSIPGRFLPRRGLACDTTNMVDRLAVLCGFRNFTTAKTRPFSTSTTPACAISRRRMGAS